jgi:hypothetical protein
LLTFNVCDHERTCDSQQACFRFRSRNCNAKSLKNWALCSPQWPCMQQQICWPILADAQS